MSKSGCIYCSSETVTGVLYVIVSTCVCECMCKSCWCKYEEHAGDVWGTEE